MSSASARPARPAATAANGSRDRFPFAPASTRAVKAYSRGGSTASSARGAPIHPHSTPWIGRT